jgi:hypothetical protein
MQLQKTKVSIRKYLLLLFVTLFLLPAGIRAGIAIPSDTAKVEVRHPDLKKIDGYRQQKAFKYARTSGRINPFRMIPQWLRNAIVRFLKMIFTPGSAELLLVILLAIAVVAFILRVNNINPISLFRRKPGDLQPLFETGNENISEMDFPLLIGKAEIQGNFRLAVRYQYLQLLATLAVNGKIELREGKTNHEYIRELNNKAPGNIFSQLVYGFEFVWYGEFLPDENQYFQISSAFDEFRKSMQE